jgi:hypothetical protein
LEGVAIPLFQSSFGNQQSAITASFGCEHGPRCDARHGEDPLLARFVMSFSSYIPQSASPLMPGDPLELE